MDTKFLKNIVGAQPVSIISETLINVKGIGEIRKKSRINGFINTNYEMSVNRQRLREDNIPDFKQEKRIWGEREGCLVKHKGKTYLAINVYRETHEYPGYSTDYIDSLIKQQKHTNQKLKKEVKVRNFNVDNIKSITVQGRTYE